jgi:hypothetical protein
MCNDETGGDILLASMVWMLNTMWEVLALCLSVWIAVKYFRDLRRLGLSTGSNIRDCFGVLIKSHVLYFARWACNWECGYLFCSNSARASFACVSCMNLILLSPVLLVRRPVADICLYPRLIISVESKFYWSSDIRRCSSNFIGGADVCVGTTPHSWYSRISRQTRCRLRCRS